MLLPSKRLKVGQQLLFGTPAGPVRGVVKYVGPLTEDTSGEIWAGVEVRRGATGPTIAWPGRSQPVPHTAAARLAAGCRGGPPLWARLL